MHSVAAVVTALLDAGFELRALREHDANASRMFRYLTRSADGMFRWLDRPWFPLSFTVLAQAR
jgi:hypothetical protein